jgi:transposase-like protein
VFVETFGKALPQTCGLVIVRGRTTLHASQVGEAGRVPWCLVEMTAQLYQFRNGLSVPWKQEISAYQRFHERQARRHAAVAIYSVVRTTFDSATRARVAAGWDGSGMAQAAYARLHGIQPRTLRLWREQFLASAVSTKTFPVAEMGVTVDALRARLAALEAELDAIRSAIAACRYDLDIVQACCPTPVAARDEPPDDAGGMPAPDGEGDDSAPPPDGTGPSASDGLPRGVGQRRPSFFSDFM